MRGSFELDTVFFPTSLNAATNGDKRRGRRKGNSIRHQEASLMKSGKKKKKEYQPHGRRRTMENRKFPSSVPTPLLPFWANREMGGKKEREREPYLGVEAATCGAGQEEREKEREREKEKEGDTIIPQKIPSLPPPLPEK